MSKTLTLAADLTGLPLDVKSNNTLTVPSGTVVTFPDANANDDLAEMVSIISPTALKDNLAVLNYALADGSNTNAISYGPFAQKTSTVLGVTPTIVSATIENAAPTIIVLTFSSAVVASVYLTGFSCTVAAVARTINSVARQSNHAILWLTLASAATNGQAVLLSFTTNQYTQSAKTGSNLRSEVGDAFVPSFTNQTVVNNTV